MKIVIGKKMITHKEVGVFIEKGGDQLKKRTIHNKEYLKIRC